MITTPWGTSVFGQTPPQGPTASAHAADTIFSGVRLFNDPSDRLSKFDDAVWDLKPMTPRGGETVWMTIRFETFPRRYVETAKRIAWCWINLRTPVEKVVRRNAARERLAPNSIAFLVREDLLRFFTWLDEAFGATLAELNESALTSYADHLREGSTSPDRVRRMLFSLTRVWLMAPYLPDEDRLCMPPWESTGLDEIVGKSTWTPENKTQPVHPQTMAALYIWAERFVRDFADDILSAVELNDRILAKSRLHKRPGDAERFRSYVAQLEAQGQPLPGYMKWKSSRTPSLAARLISGLYDIGTNAMLARNRVGHPIGETAPLPMAVQGRLDSGGAPWLPFIDHYNVRTLRTLLATACFVVTAYLSGMRSEEVLALRSGCLSTEDVGPGQPKRYSVRGLHFKSATDERGNAIPEGAIRERPWHVIQPVAEALQVASRLSNGDFIFDWGMFVSSGAPRKGTHAPRVMVNRALDDFFAWVNQYCDVNNIPHEMIPPDPEGLVSVSRFRRTLAWFIYRQPGGRIALGVQYGHLRGFTSEGYGSRASSGMRGVFPVEEALALADSLGDAADRLADREAVSGPAAERYIDGVSEFAKNFSGKRMTTKQLNALHTNPRLRIFDNGLQPVACCYDATKSLCHPGNANTANHAQTPDLTRCQPHCSNVARTDRHIDAVRAEVDALRHDAELKATPEPIAKRYRQRIETLEAIICEHEQSKVTVTA